MLSYLRTLALTTLIAAAIALALSTTSSRLEWVDLRDHSGPATFNVR